MEARLILLYYKIVSLRKHAFSNYRQKNESFKIKKSDIFHISAQNIDWGTRENRFDEAVLTSTYKLCFEKKYEK